MENISNCCGAAIIENSDYCKSCGDHCEAMKEETAHAPGPWYPASESIRATGHRSEYVEVWKAADAALVNTTGKPTGFILD